MGLNHSNMLRVDGVAIKSPSKMSISLQDVSAAGSGRTQDSLMHKNRVSQKWKIQLAWNNTSPADTASILTAFNPEYIDVEFMNPMTASRETRTFYVGDRSAPVKIWSVANKIYESVAFDIIER
jgi:hypothetical protein